MSATAGTNGTNRTNRTNGADGAQGGRVAELLGQLPGDGEGGPAQAPGTAAADGGRAADGRFAPGNKFGPGNPYARQVAALRKALVESVTAEEVALVGRMLLHKALEGDLAAARLLLSYAIGKPAAVDPDTLDRQEYEVFRQAPVAPQEMSELAKCLPADWAVDVLRHVLPCRSATVRGLNADVLQQKIDERGQQQDRQARKEERTAARKARREAEKTAARPAAEVQPPVPAPVEGGGRPDPAGRTPAGPGCAAGVRPAAGPPPARATDPGGAPPSPNGPDGDGAAAPPLTNGPDGGAAPAGRRR